VAAQLAAPQEGLKSVSKLEYRNTQLSSCVLTVTENGIIRKRCPTKTSTISLHEGTPLRFEIIFVSYGPTCGKLTLEPICYFCNLAVRH
jgi:hypothetical protein